MQGEQQRPAIYSFPPFFTKQRNQEVELQRKDDWVKWIVQWARERKRTEILVEKELGGELFGNDAIRRRLKLEDAIEILDYMAMKGNGFWGRAGKSEFHVLYKSLHEWMKLLNDWVDATGQMGSVFTVYELLEGDDTTKEEFHGMDRALFLKVLAYMEEQGCAKIFSASDPAKIGVKIFRPNA